MKYIRVGRIVNTFGIRGQLKVIADTDFAEERFAKGQQLYVLDDEKEMAHFIVEKAQIHKGTYLVSFDGVSNINQVEQYKGMWLAIDSKDQEELPEDEFYHHQIIGLKVITTEGEALGTIKEILQLGSNDVWVVKRHEAKKKDVLLPYIESVVKKVDISEGTVLVELMEGLVDEN